MTGLLQRIAIAVCLAALLASTGLFAIIVQATGWAKMYDAYSERLSPSQAITATFSGQDLCGVCLAAQDIHRDMDNALSAYVSSQSTQLLWISVSQLPNLAAPSTAEPAFIEPDRKLVHRAGSVESPPPKVLA